jgi:hypothetical protein
MNEAAQLQLVILYDAQANRYTVIDHNLHPRNRSRGSGKAPW